MLRVKLKRLEDDNQRRRKLAALYKERLAGTDLILPREQEDTAHIYHLYVARTVNRERLIKSLSEKGVGSAIHYPVPIHKQPAYSARALNLLPLPVTEKISAEIVSLPMFPQLTVTQVERVCEVIMAQQA
jgi:dTDP-4-amino-4,6-dideoxygalactose transaminase